MRLRSRNRLQRAYGIHRIRAGSDDPSRALPIACRGPSPPIRVGHGTLHPMPDDAHAPKEALIDLAEWHDRWRDEPELEPLVEAVRRAWIGYVAARTAILRRNARNGGGRIFGVRTVEDQGALGRGRFYLCRFAPSH